MLICTTRQHRSEMLCLCAGHAVHYKQDFNSFRRRCSQHQAAKYLPAVCSARPSKKLIWLVSSDVTTNFDTKTELDVKNRLIAKFAIPRAKHFWNSGFEAMPESALFPSGDSVEDLCREIGARTREVEQSSSSAGEFLLEWAELEKKLVPLARQLTERNVSIGEAIEALTRQKRLSRDVATVLHDIRKLRNAVVHSAAKVEPWAIDDALNRLREASRRLPPF